MKSHRISSLVFGSLILSSGIVAACATAEYPDIGGAAPEANMPSTGGSDGAGTSGASAGGSTSSTDTGGTSAGGSFTGVGGTGSMASGGTTASGGSGAGKGGTGNASGGSASGGAASGGKGGSGGTTAAGGTGSGGKGGSGATGGTTASGGTGPASGGTGPTGGSGGSGTVVNIDLSTFQPAGVGTYNSTNQTLTVAAQPFFQFPLPKTFTAGQSLAVHVTGTNNGSAGLRSWLVNGTQTTLSNVVTTYVGTGLPSGSFTLDYTLTATDAAGFLFFKGPMVGTNIDNVTVATITVTY